jgi:hypothetical protein
MNGYTLKNDVSLSITLQIYVKISKNSSDQVLEIQLQLPVHPSMECLARNY